MSKLLRLVALAVAAALVTTGCISTDDPGASGESPTITAPEYLAFRDQPTACGAEPPDPVADLQFSEPEDLGLSGTIDVILETSCGDVTLQLDADTAPITVNSFVFLAERGYFDGIALHRVVPGYIVQIGDPTASGFGFPGYRIDDELPAPDFIYERGVVAMANAGSPRTGGSQFFVMIQEAPLPPTYTPFGVVASGFDVIDLMAAVPMGPQPGGSEPSRPLETIYVNRVEVVGR